MNKKILVLFILILAAVLRLWQFGSVPPSPDWDEAALGYNAYSLLVTGKDEYGKTYPVVLQSFDDYKPALYTYLIIPMIPIFGLDIVSVRLPSVLVGIAGILLTYLLVKELVNRFNVKKKKESNNIVDYLPLASAFLLAISPWHIQFSRVAFETNLGLTCNIALVYFFLRGLRNPFFLSLAAVFSALSLYAYQSEKIFVPLLVLCLAVIYQRELMSLKKKYLVTAFLVGCVAIFPLVHFTLTNEDALARARSTSIFSNNQELLAPSVEKLIQAKEENNYVGTLINNRRVVYAQTMVENYFAHFNPVWLFFTGDIPRHHAPGMGLLYHWELPFLIIGLGTLLISQNKWLGRREKYLLFSWFLLAPFPASITTDVPHAVRTLNFLPTFQIFIAVGLLSVFIYLSNNRFVRRLFIILWLVIAVVNVSYYLNQYFNKQNTAYSSEWQYGYREAVTVAEERKDEYEKVVVANQSPMDQSYIFFLYYLKYPPSLYQQDQNNNKAFSQYEFRPIEWEKDKRVENTLFIGSPKDFPEDIEPLYTISYLDGEPAIFFVEPSN